MKLTIETEKFAKIRYIRVIRVPYKSAGKTKNLTYPEYSDPATPNHILFPTQDQFLNEFLHSFLVLIPYSPLP
jgi:hypothetical protein